MGKQGMSEDAVEKLWQEAKELRRSGKSGKIKKAIKLMERVLNERNDGPPVSTMLRTFIGDCYHIDLKQHDKAMEYYQRARNEDINDPWASIMIGEILYNEKKDYKAAADILDQTLARGVPSSGQREIAKDYLVWAKQKLAGKS